MKSVARVIPLVKFDICSLDMSVDHIISEICNSRIGEVILISDNTTLLDYEHQFMGSLHAVGSRSRTLAVSFFIYKGYWSAVYYL